MDRGNAAPPASVNSSVWCLTVDRGEGIRRVQDSVGSAWVSLVRLLGRPKAVVQYQPPFPVRPRSFFPPHSHSHSLALERKRERRRERGEERGRGSRDRVRDRHSEDPQSSPGGCSTEVREACSREVCRERDVPAHPCSALTSVTRASF